MHMADCDALQLEDPRRAPTVIRRPATPTHHWISAQSGNGALSYLRLSKFSPSVFRCPYRRRQLMACIELHQIWGWQPLGQPLDICLPINRPISVVLDFTVRYLASFRNKDGYKASEWGRKFRQISHFVTHMKFRGTIGEWSVWIKSRSA